MTNYYLEVCTLNPVRNGCTILARKFVKPSSKRSHLSGNNIKVGDQGRSPIYISNGVSQDRGLYYKH